MEEEATAAAEGWAVARAVGAMAAAAMAVVATAAVAMAVVAMVVVAMEVAVAVAVGYDARHAHHARLTCAHSFVINVRRASHHRFPFPPHA